MDCMFILLPTNVHFRCLIVFRYYNQLPITVRQCPVLQCPVLQCPPLRTRPSLSSPVMSNPVFYSSLNIQSCNFSHPIDALLCLSLGASVRDHSRTKFWRRHWNGYAVIQVKITFAFASRVASASAAIALCSCTGNRTSFLHQKYAIKHCTIYHLAINYSTMLKKCQISEISWNLTVQHFCHSQNVYFGFFAFKQKMRECHHFTTYLWNDPRTLRLKLHGSHKYSQYEVATWIKIVPLRQVRLSTLCIKNNIPYHGVYHYYSVRLHTLWFLRRAANRNSTSLLIVLLTRVLTKIPTLVNRFSRHLRHAILHIQRCMTWRCLIWVERSTVSIDILLDRLQSSSLWF